MGRALVWIQAHPPLQIQRKCPCRAACCSVIPTAVAASGLLLINTQPQCQHQGEEVMLILGIGGLFSWLALWSLPDSCHTPSLRLQRVGHWRSQYHRKAGTSAAPEDILNTHKYTCTYNVYSYNTFNTFVRAKGYTQRVW